VSVWRATPAWGLDGLRRLRQERRHRQPEPLVKLLEQPTLLPSGILAGSQRDQ